MLMKLKCLLAAYAWNSANDFKLDLLVDPLKGFDESCVIYG